MRFGIQRDWLKAGLAVAVIAGLAACGPKEEGGNPPPSGGNTPSTGGTAAAGGKKTVGVCLTSRNHNFFIGMEQGVTDQLKAEGIEFEVSVAEDSASTQQQQVATFIRKGVNAIIMVPVDAQQAIVPVEEANKANIPIFCIDRRVTDTKANVTSTIETDNAKMGKAAAEYGLKLLCERYKLDPTKPDDVKKLKCKIVHMWGIESASSAQDRAKGIEEVFNPTNTPGVTVVKGVGDFNSKKSQEVFASLLRGNPDIELVVSHGDDNSMGCYQAILDVKGKREAATDPKRIFLVGMDGNKPAIEKIREGEIEATVSQQPIQMGVECVKQVKKVLDGGKPDNVYIPISHELITKKEADEKKGQLWSDQLKSTK
jgi:ribose transport system substrate-binding protein